MVGIDLDWKSEHLGPYHFLCLFLVILGRYIMGK